jgi:hypothetical protein
LRLIAIARCWLLLAHSSGGSSRYACHRSILPLGASASSAQPYRDWR